MGFVGLNDPGKFLPPPEADVISSNIHELQQLFSSPLCFGTVTVGVTKEASWEFLHVNCSFQVLPWLIWDSVETLVPLTFLPCFSTYLVCGFFHSFTEKETLSTACNPEFSEENYKNNCLYAIEALETKYFFYGAVGLVNGTCFPLDFAPYFQKEDYWMSKIVYVFHSLIICCHNQQIIYDLHPILDICLVQHSYWNSKNYHDINYHPKIKQSSVTNLLRSKIDFFQPEELNRWLQVCIIFNNLTSLKMISRNLLSMNRNFQVNIQMRMLWRIQISLI
ncbi:hypothetical protein VP01_1185g2 [Puccinia sorghi]|uniref:Uncharacterized protein n=1 Tax=Puccinia sorghi TaxID=27349 RepID=A0A0L6VR66_9BASI|nr:hypothetical protein VP01_1185g2 [Puccinia sorghi]